jgi:hypothetical protein
MAKGLLPNAPSPGLHRKRQCSHMLSPDSATVRVIFPIRGRPRERGPIEVVRNSERVTGHPDLTRTWQA